MELQQAQNKIVAAIAADPESVIAACERFRAGTAELVAEVRKVPGTIAGCAAAAIQYACQNGASRDVVVANMIKLAASL